MSEVWGGSTCPPPGSETPTSGARAGGALDGDALFLELRVPDCLSRGVLKCGESCIAASLAMRRKNVIPFRPTSSCEPPLLNFSARWSGVADLSISPSSTGTYALSTILYSSPFASSSLDDSKLFSTSVGCLCESTNPRNARADCKFDSADALTLSFLR